jgi:hypothetical protein
MCSLLHRIALSACACTASAAALTVHAADLPQHGPIEAVWKAQSVMFEYRSAGRFYPCEVLEYKIRMVLHRLGARERLELRRHRCSDLDGSARLEVLMESPVAATEDNVRDITRYDSKDELVARVRGVDLPSPPDLQRFPATWESVSFRKLRLDAGDCALVQQLRRQVLPKMSIQVIKDITGVGCDLEFAGFIGPRFTVLALVPASVPQ